MADSGAQPASPTPTKKARQGRSPAFPFIALDVALARADALRVAEGGRPKHFSPRASLAKAWGFGEKTGALKQTVAALGHFGLLEFEGAAENRAARLTETAFRVLLDKQPDSPERDAAVQEIALAPPIHKELWEKWRTNLPSDPTLETYLVRDRGFSESGARDLIAEYKATLAFAKIGQPAIIPSPDPVKPLDASQQAVEIGDAVQVELNGAQQFPKPKRVRAIRDHEGKKWVFVEGETAGLSMESVQVVTKGAASEPQTATAAAPQLALSESDKRTVRRQVFALAEGDVTITFPEGLSAESVDDLEGFLKPFINRVRREAKKSN